MATKSQKKPLEPVFDLAGSPRSKKLYLRAKLQDTVIGNILFGHALLSFAITVCILGVLALGAFEFFYQISVLDFLLGREWAPLFEPRKFGALPIIWGTLLVSIGSAFISIPLGLLTAFYLSEYASDRTRAWVKPSVEILAGIPSVVFGYFALTTVTPFLRGVLPETEVFNAFSASIVVGIMTLPMVCSLSDDAFRAVPQTLREGGYALGATKHEVTLKVVLPAAASGVIASFILAFSRAIGETMAVTLAAGATPNLTFSLLESVQTMTAYIVQVSLGDTPHGTVEYYSLFAVALVLFIITLFVNILSQIVIKRAKKHYV